MCLCAQSLSHVRLFATPRTVAHQAQTLSMGFPRQEYWSGLSFPSPVETPMYMRNAGLEGAQAGIKIARRNINNLRYTDDTILMAESEELKSLLMKVKEKSEKVGLKLNIQKDKKERKKKEKETTPTTKLNIQKTKIMASGPITSW